MGQFKQNAESIVLWRNYNIFSTHFDKLEKTSSTKGSLLPSTNNLILGSVPEYLNNTRPSSCISSLHCASDSWRIGISSRGNFSFTGKAPDFEGQKEKLLRELRQIILGFNKVMGHSQSNI